jgi:hypothetical protein
MAGVLNTSTSYEQRSVIRFLLSKRRTPTEIHREMQPTYGDKCLALRSVRWWCCEFINAREDLNDEWSGRTDTSLTSNNIARMDAMVKVDRRVHLKVISKELGISYGRVYDIVQIGRAHV